MPRKVRHLKSSLEGDLLKISVMGMYRNADLVVKSVMIGLLLASIVTWALFFAKGSYLLALRRRLRNESAQLVEAKSLKEALAISQKFGNKSATADFLMMLN